MNTVDALNVLGKALCGDSFEVKPGLTDAETILEIAKNYSGGSGGGEGGGSADVPVLRIVNLRDGSFSDQVIGDVEGMTSWEDFHEVFPESDLQPGKELKFILELSMPDDVKRYNASVAYGGSMYNITCPIVDTFDIIDNSLSMIDIRGAFFYDDEKIGVNLRLNVYTCTLHKEGGDS